MENIDKIKEYLFGRMSESEVKAFENDVSNNPNLAKELEFQRLEWEVIEAMDRYNLKKQLESFRQEVIDQEVVTTITVTELKPVTKIKYITFIRAIAASIVILICVFFYETNQYSNNALYQLAYKSETPDYSNLRSVDNKSSNFENMYIDILIQQNQSEASNAITYFQSFNNQSPLYIQAQFNLAHAFLLNKDYNKSLDIFRRLLNASFLDTPLKQEVQYDIAMILIKMGNDDEAKKILSDIIIDPSHRFRNSASILLEKLNSFWRKI